MNKTVWVRIDLINKESYIGSINIPKLEVENDLFDFLEEEAYMGLKLDNVHICSEKNGSIDLVPLDSENSIYKSTMLVLNIDNILTLKFIKEDSSILKRLKIKKSSEKFNSKNNVLKLSIVKKGS